MVVDKCHDYLDYFFFCSLQKNNIHRVMILCNASYTVDFLKVSLTPVTMESKLGEV